MSSDDIDNLLSPSVDPQLWPQIRQAAIERYEAESRSVRPPQTPARSELHDGGKGRTADKKRAVKD